MQVSGRAGRWAAVAKDLSLWHAKPRLWIVVQGCRWSGACGSPLADSMAERWGTTRPTSGAMQASRRSLIVFLGLTFALSWSAWLPATLASRNIIAAGVAPGPASVVGAFGPSLAAVMVVAVTERGRGLRSLLIGLVRWRVGVGWYLLAVLFPAVLSVSGAALGVVAGGAWPDYADPPVLREYPLPAELASVGAWPLLPLIFLQYLLFSSPLGEELGWRGYALPTLQRRHTALHASLIIGAVWGLWHVPLALTVGHPLSEQFFGWFLLGIVADAVLFTWLYNSTGGSLLLAVVFHASIAVTGLFLGTPADATGPLTLLLKWLVVAVVLAATGVGLVTSVTTAASKSRD